MSICVGCGSDVRGHRIHSILDCDVIAELRAQLAAQRKEERERHRSLRDVLQTVASYNIHQGGTGHLNITTVLMEIDRHAPQAEESE